jgi:hypothetical protein
MRIVGPPYLLVCEFDRSCNGRLLGEELEERGECEREFELGSADEDMSKYGEKKIKYRSCIYSEDFRSLKTLN